MNQRKLKTSAFPLAFNVEINLFASISGISSARTNQLITLNHRANGSFCIELILIEESKNIRSVFVNHFSSLFARSDFLFAIHLYR